MIFVDTGGWFARFVPDDPDHARVAAWFAANREHRHGRNNRQARWQLAGRLTRLSIEQAWTRPRISRIG